ncbi:MAG: hypothetical protein GY801_18355 [bacterium]|nr:hypothetical protein [bacterium]
MSASKRDKLQRLVTGWSRGTVAVASYLKTLGITPELLYTYKRSQWIQALGTGAYMLSGDTVEWPGAVYALQAQLSLNVHVGGKTALEMKGYAHYLSDKLQQVFLFGPPRQKLPMWFRNYPWKPDIVFTSTNLFPEDCQEGFSEFHKQEFSIRISSPERAALEMLYHVPGKVGFNEAFLIVENLINLRPTVLQPLLDACSNIKVKRLFLYMAEQHHQPWFSQLLTADIELGTGKRVVVEHGILDKQYMITVPKSTMEPVF